MSRDLITGKVNKSRATIENIDHRFSRLTKIPITDNWWHENDQSSDITELIKERSKSIISVNQSPDVPFEQSINPYRGCEHGCVYCYARPSHAYWDLSPGYDFESKIIYKENAVELLEKKLRSRSYQCKPITIGANTDAYQPIEKKLRLTRSLLETLLKYNHPVHLITKGQGIIRDLDILALLAQNNLVSVGISLTTLDNSLKTILEPRAASPSTRLSIISKLSDCGVPVSVLVAPIIPAINDCEIESILTAAKENGAKNAAYIMLRLPHEVQTIFIRWLERHYPLRKQKVLNYLNELRKGQLNSNQFGSRMTGEGIFADTIKQRFELSCKKLRLIHTREAPSQLNTELFSKGNDQQLKLF
ncbi:PA0069 family radical SAM protein [Aliikangiella maris]|uniref:PA0069 family radical SAM protein n=2 Tax=Aliikangiella maris TaxID=3162458 RepID=A0ABV3MUN5_9GAMM